MKLSIDDEYFHIIPENEAELEQIKKVYALHFTNGYFRIDKFLPDVLSGEDKGLPYLSLQNTEYMGLEHTQYLAHKMIDDLKNQ